MDYSVYPVIPVKLLTGPATPPVTVNLMGREVRIYSSGPRGKQLTLTSPMFLTESVQ